MTLLAAGAEWSITVTEVDIEATVTPEIRSVATRLSAFTMLAVAMEPGPDEIPYGGVPPLIETFCEAPAPRLTDAGTALNPEPAGGGPDMG